MPLRDPRGILEGVGQQPLSQNRFTAALAKVCAGDVSVSIEISEYRNSGRILSAGVGLPKKRGFVADTIRCLLSTIRIWSGPSWAGTLTHLAVVNRQ